MLSFLAAPLVSVVDAALAAAPAGRIAVFDQPSLSRRLAQRGRDAVLVAEAGATRRRPAGALEGRADTLPFEPGALVGLVGPGPLRLEDWEAAFGEWRRVVQEDGVIVVLGRGEPTEPARRALCGGLTDVAQRQVGRTLVTSGRIVRLG